MLILLLTVVAMWTWLLAVILCLCAVAKLADKHAESTRAIGAHSHAAP